MDCDEFVSLVESELGNHLIDPSSTKMGNQCAVDFYHPRTKERLKNQAGQVAPMYRSGVVWLEPTRTISLELRVPDDFDDEVTKVLSDHPFERTDNRAAPTSSGDLLSLIHYRIKYDNATEERIRETLNTVREALKV
ncbi:MAG: hypothetical protein SV377_03295 [Halobacteria archaeon]|nr:hypothetical protein [Halobacteria archaeon]